MSGKNQAHKGKSYGRMQWKSYQAVAWGYAQPSVNRLCSTEKDSESGTAGNGSSGAEQSIIQ